MMYGPPSWRPYCRTSVATLTPTLTVWGGISFFSPRAVRKQEGRRERAARAGTTLGSEPASPGACLLLLDSRRRARSHARSLGGVFNSTPLLSASGKSGLGQVGSPGARVTEGSCLFTSALWSCKFGRVSVNRAIREYSLLVPQIIIMLVNYSDDSDDEDGNVPPSAAPAILALSSVNAADDNSDDDDDDEEAKKQERVPEVIEPEADASSGLPDFEEALLNAETPAFLSPEYGGEFEHHAFDETAASAAGTAAAASEAAATAASAAMAVARAAARSSSSAAKPSAAATAAAVRDKARGVAAKAKEKEKESIKDRTKEKRKRDQSASFLGGRWKSDEEMHMRCARASSVARIRRSALTCCCIAVCWSNCVLRSTPVWSAATTLTLEFFSRSAVPTTLPKPRSQSAHRNTIYAHFDRPLSADGHQYALASAGAGGAAATRVTVEGASPSQAPHASASQCAPVVARRCVRAHNALPFRVARKISHTPPIVLLS